MYLRGTCLQEKWKSLAAGGPDAAPDFEFEGAPSSLVLRGEGFSHPKEEPRPALALTHPPESPHHHRLHTLPQPVSLITMLKESPLLTGAGSIALFHGKCGIYVCGVR